MPVYRYPFVQMGINDMPRPKLPVRIINPHTGQLILTWALIDTGADMCAVPADLAQALGHTLDAVGSNTISTGAGKGSMYHHTFQIEILKTDLSVVNGFDPNLVVHTIQSSPIACAVGLQTVLLGVSGFLQDYILTVNYQELFFSVQRNFLYDETENNLQPTTITTPY